MISWLTDVMLKVESLSEDCFHTTWSLMQSHKRHDSYFEGAEVGGIQFITASLLCKYSSYCL